MKILGAKARHPRGGLMVAAIAVVLAAAAGAGADVFRRAESGQRPPGGDMAQAGRPFSLVGPSGRPVTDRDFRGRFMLVYFGYTTCPGHCPTMLMMTAAALETLGPRARQVQAIFITVDPEHDTPAVMGRFTGRFSRRILGLTGSPSQIEAAEKAYGVQTLFRRTGPAADAYVIDHPSVFYLVGPDGRFVSELQADGAAELAARIRSRL